MTGILEFHSKDGTYNIINMEYISMVKIGNKKVGISGKVSSINLIVDGFIEQFYLNESDDSVTDKDLDKKTFDYVCSELIGGDEE